MSESFPGAYVLDEDMDESTDDADFVPSTADDGDDDEDMRDFLAAAAAEAEGENDEVEADEPAQANGQGQGLSIGIDRATNRIVLLDQTGNPVALGRTGAAMFQQFLARATNFTAGGRRIVMQEDDDEDDDDGGEWLPEEEDEDEDDEEDGGWGWGRRPARQKNWYPVAKQPDPKGVELLRSGDFGRAPRYLSRLSELRTSPRSSSRRLSTASSKPAPDPPAPFTASLHSRRSTHLNVLLRQTDSLLPLHRSARWASRVPFGGADASQGRRGPDAGGVAMGNGDDWGDRLAIPNSDGTEVSTFGSRIYSGQYSDDGGFFYTASQAYKIYIYDMTTPPNVLTSKSVNDSVPAGRPGPGDEDMAHPGGRGWGWGFGRGAHSLVHRSSLTLSRTFQARERDCRWTITDAALSPCNSWLVYSSITPVVQLVKTRGQDAVLGLGLEDHEQERLDFDRGAEGFGIWSLRFDSDGKQVAAGCSHGILTVYDVERKEPVVSIRGHADDVNALCFADKYDPNILVSGADDALLKVWDRRALRSGAAGVLVGHTEGVTYVEGKGDGRYVLSNAKDQGAKMWDLRSMATGREYARGPKIDAGIPGWDYRSGMYRKPAFVKHPHDRSVVTYRGHSVLQTLIRAHISPPSTTGQRFVYSGSADGKIHIWHLDGRIAQVLDRSKSRPLNREHRPTSTDKDDPAVGGTAPSEFNDPAAPVTAEELARNRRRNARELDRFTVRDVSWHPYEPTLMSTCWGGTGASAEGSLAMHHWLGEGKAAA